MKFDSIYLLYLKISYFGKKSRSYYHTYI